MTLFQKKAKPKLALAGVDPALQRSFVFSWFLVASSGAPELGAVSVHFGPVNGLTASLFMPLTMPTYVEYKFGFN